MSPSAWKGKGKQRAVSSSIEGPGGSDGVVLPLELVGGGVYDVAYILPVRVGSNSKSFSLQVDTGSSDLWLASTSCSTSSCSLTGGKLYDPSNADPTGVDFDISYLQGRVSGPIVWDRVEVGDYSIDNQALAAASVVSDEPLAPNFNGILGLALPLNSIIASRIPPVTGNNPDGAAWASNLFTITPSSSAPSARFISLSLSRPGSDRVPSLLGLGRHPSAIVTDPSKVYYSTLVSDRAGVLFWKVSVTAITVYVDGNARPVDIGRSNTGAVFPNAVLDSGVPLILTTSKVANGIYGALGIGPAADGQYYVPCNTPLNMTITLDDRPETPIHPLDLTAEPPKDNQAQFCVGLIQAADSQLSNPTSGVGDMILGVPFMRNTYTVMAYENPDDDGEFVSPSDATIRPHLGLMSLTDPTTALNEFHTVRFLNQPISSTSNHTNQDPQTANVGSKKLSVGIIVLLGLVGFFALCCALFGLRWILLRRKYNRNGRLGGDNGMAGASRDVLDLDSKIALHDIGSGRTSGTVVGDGRSSVGNETPEKHTLPYGFGALGMSRSFDDVHKENETVAGGVAGLRRTSTPADRTKSEYTMSSERTRIEERDGDVAGEFGYDSRNKMDHNDNDVGSNWGADREIMMRSGRHSSRDSSNVGRSSRGGRIRLDSNASATGGPHERNSSLFIPLLSRDHRHSQSFDTDGGGEHGPPSGQPMFSAGLTGGREDVGDGANRDPVGTDVIPDLNEFGFPGSGSGDGVETMAGVGSGAGAAARRRWSKGGPLPFPRDSVWSGSSGNTVVAADEERWQPGYPDVTAEVGAIVERRKKESTSRTRVRIPSKPSPALMPDEFDHLGSAASRVKGRTGMRSPSLVLDFDPYYHGHPAP
ncbi:hypothetical protein AX17_003722 [Amanita inopinata Kibby_2008]|nr:hypothetical protein AX17_003722 [Amanita inopinata Kibby_2008]